MGGGVRPGRGRTHLPPGSHSCHTAALRRDHFHFSGQITKLKHLLQQQIYQNTFGNEEKHVSVLVFKETTTHTFYVQLNISELETLQNASQDDCRQPRVSTPDGELSEGLQGMILMKRRGHHGGTCSTRRQMVFDVLSNKRKETGICLNSGPASFLSKRKNGFLCGMFWTNARSRTYRRFPKCALLPRKSWKQPSAPALKASDQALSANPHHPLLTALG